MFGVFGVPGGPGRVAHEPEPEEHRAAGELVLPDLEKTKVTSDQFGGRAKVLKELVEHHADEEEKEMFPRARKLLDKAALTELGQQMQARKQELLKSL